jgi:HK97 family phage portal protein
MDLISLDLAPTAPTRRAAPQAKASATTRAIVLGSGYYGPAWPDGGSPHIEREYERNPTVFACVNVIAKAAAGVPWLCYRDTLSARARKALRQTDPRRNVVPLGRKRTEEVNDHPILELLQRPNPFQGGAGLIEQIASSYLLGGNAYLEGVRVNGGPARELWALRPDRVKVVPSAVNLVAGYEYRVGSQVQQFPASAVLHLKTFHEADDFYGLSPLQAAARAVATDNAAARWNDSLLNNGARPSGAFKVASTMNHDSFQELRDAVEDIYAGTANAGRPLVLEGGIDWQSIGLGPADMDFLNSRKLSKREIAAVFGVPPEIVGDAESKTFSNYREARKALYLEAVLPFLDRLRDGLNAWLAPQFGGGLYVDYDRDQIEALQEDQAALWKRIEDSTCLTVNEKRVALGYSEVPSGDVVLVSASMAPLSTVGFDGRGDL